MSIIFDSLRTSGEDFTKNCMISYFDFSKSKDFDDFGVCLNAIISDFGWAIRIFGKEDLLDGVKMLDEEINNSTDNTRHFVIFDGINRAKRLFDSEDQYSMRPIEILKKMFKIGPEKGYHFIVWANDPIAFNDYYGDSLRSFDNRIVYDLDDDLFRAYVIESRLKTQSRSDVVVYNPDEDNMKIRIYDLPQQKWYDNFVSRINDRLTK